MGKPNKRFSYLLLDEGEFYIQDWMAICRSGLVTSKGAQVQPWQQLRLKGRLRLCSKSIFFEPDNISAPIIMLPLSKVKKIEGVSEPPMSPSPVNSKWSRRQEGFVLETAMYVKMKEGGFDAPYVFEKQDSRWWFSLEFAPVQQFILQAQSLLSINLLPPAEREMVLRNAMAQKEAQGRFDTSRLADLNERIVFDCPAAQVTPLVREPGRLVLTQTRLYFQPLHNLNNDSPVRSQPLNSIVAVARRRHALRHTGLEIFFTELDLVSRNTLGSESADGGSVFFTFSNGKQRDDAAAKLLNQLGGHTSMTAAVGSLLEADSSWLELVMSAWQEGRISNYDYLIYLNLAAGRTFCDLTQWPVMPWILKDYKSEILDLNSSETFRDLSKPIGALNVERLSIFKERYNQMQEEDGSDPPFLYGTHYSTPGYVLYWLVRCAPAHMLRLQNGRFDAPDRLFVSILESWESVTSNPADLKELIPEFWACPGHFLSMRDDLNLGVRQGGDLVGNVKLPPWATSPDDFIKKHQEALECEHVSKTLHLWIDLIFGFKQRGEAAFMADNIFHHLTYEGSVDLEEITDPVQRAGLEAQINEFGQVPRQLFFKPHPARVKVLGRPSNIAKDSEGIPQEVFKGVSPHFLKRIMAVVSFFQDNRAGNAFNTAPLSSPVWPPPSTDLQMEPVINSRREPNSSKPFESEERTETSDAEQRFLRLTITTPGKDQKFMSLGSARMEEEQRFGWLARTRSEYKRWDYWSPASNSESQLNESKISEEAVDQQHHEMRTLVGERLATSGLSTFHRALDVHPAREDQDGTPYHICLGKNGTDERSPGPWIFREQIFLKQSLRLHRGPVKAVLISEENASEFLTLYSAGQDGFVKVYSLQEGFQIRATKLGNLPLSALALAGSCDDYPIVLAGSYDNCLYAYSVDYGRALGKMRVHEETVSCVKIIDHSFQRLITASWDATVKIWTMEEGRGGWSTGFGVSLTNNDAACTPEGQFLEHDGAILSLDVEQDGYLVVSGEEDGTVIGWDLRHPSSMVWQQCDVLKGPAAGIRLIKDGTKLVAASGEGNVHLLDIRQGGALIATWDCKTSLKCLEATNEIILAGSATGGLHVCPVDFESQDCGRGFDGVMLNPNCSPLQDHNGSINSISISSNRSRLAASLTTASDDGCIQVYNIKHS